MTNSILYDSRGHGTTAIDVATEVKQGVQRAWDVAGTFGRG